MAHKIGKQTFVIDRRVMLRAGACIVGPLEKEGPLGDYFDQKAEEDFGEDTWEKGEARFVEATYGKLMAQLNMEASLVDCILSGDLLNQCTASACGLKQSGRPFVGLFGACSTMAESLLVGSLLVDGGGMNHVVCMTSSNFCSSEKQFRFPLELGGQRPPTSQWTVTGSGAVLLSAEGQGPVVTSVTPGIIEDYEIADANNMGAAMAPSAASTIIAHLADTGREASFYDLIVTGDLGITGSGLLREILQMHGHNVFDETRKGALPAPIPEHCGFFHQDCGALIFDPLTQGTASGGSGCGCSAVVLTGYIMKLMQQKILNKVLFVATGALMSPVSVKQGDPILGVAHAIALENC